MAEEQKQSWWKSLPGLLTAGSGFVAALSGLVAGLNQLGVFRRDQPAQQVVVVAQAARDSTAQHTAAPVTSGSASSAAPAPAPASTPSGGTSSKAPTVSSPRPASPSTPASASAPRPASSADTRRAGSPAAPQVRLDSLVQADGAIAVPPSQVRFRRDAVSGTCLRADARITVTLGAATTVRRR